MLPRFHHHVVWITGGGSGLGAAMAERFAAEGAHVVVSGRRVQRLHEVVARITALGHSAHALPCDVTSDTEVADAVQQIVARFARLDVVVANAGYSVLGPIAELRPEHWRAQFEVNVFGVVSVVRHALPHLRSTGGRVALVGSVASFVHGPDTGCYSASKAAVRSIGLALSAELLGTGVSCTTLHPGLVASEIGQVDNDGVRDPGAPDPRPALLLWPTDRAARVMVEAVWHRRREVVFTGHGRLLAAMSRWLPGLLFAVVARTGRHATAPKPGNAR